MENQEPEAARLSYPQNSGIDISILPEFQWEPAIDPDGDKIRYEIRISPDYSEWTTLASDLTDNYYQPEERISRNETYYWQIIAYDSYGGKSESTIFTFHTANLTAPLLTSPSNGALVDDKGWLEWNSPENTDSPTIFYDIEISADGTNWESFQTDIRTTRCEFSTTNRNRCYWQVVARDDYNGLSVSDPGYFEQEIQGYRDGTVFVYQENTATDVPYPVELIYTGDGYTASELRYEGKFIKDMKKAIEALFSIEPYKTYRNYFKVWVVAAESQESGSTILKQFNSGVRLPAMKRNTVFSTVVEGGSSTKIQGNTQIVLDYAMKIPGMTREKLGLTSIMVTVNINAYCGTAAFVSSGETIAYSGADVNLGSSTIHEGGGHGFGRLLDEYFLDENMGLSLSEYWRGSIKLLRKGDPWNYAANLALPEDLSSLHWSHYFTLPKYNSVKLYQGARLFPIGVYRPEEKSVMGQNSSYHYFNAPSREAIVRKIMKMAGGEFSFERFLEKDVHIATRRTDYVEIPEYIIHTSPQFVDAN